MTIETMIVLRSRPDELTSAGGGGGTLDEAAAGAAGASGASGAGGLTYGSTGSLLAPFKKFAEAAGEADATEATPRHMGCVPCALPLDASAATWLAPTADDELPLLATLPAGWRVETGALVSAGLGDGGRMAAAEATTWEQLENTRSSRSRKSDLRLEALSPCTASEPPPVSDDGTLEVLCSFIEDPVYGSSRLLIPKDMRVSPNYMASRLRSRINFPSPPRKMTS
jgi:hypothetical protein